MGIIIYFTKYDYRYCIHVVTSSDEIAEHSHVSMTFLTKQVCSDEIYNYSISDNSLSARGIIAIYIYIYVSARDTIAIYIYMPGCDTIAVCTFSYMITRSSSDDGKGFQHRAHTTSWLSLTQIKYNESCRRTTTLVAVRSFV